MYNTDFIVKYHDIKEELLEKKNLNNFIEYSEDDILDICSKLYRDELTSVFYAEDITDEKIDHGIKEISEKMLTNQDFTDIMIELRIQFQNYMANIFIDSDNNDYKNIDFIIFLTLFSDNIFYIMHKCICQQLLEGNINNLLLLELKKLALNLILTKD